MKRLAIITTHPVQYHSPIFSELSKEKDVRLKVFYTWGPASLDTKYDHGFKKEIKWDIPLLEGYDYSFVENVAKEKGSHYFNGIKNPTLIDEITAWEADAVLIFGWRFNSHLKALRHFKGKIPVLFRGDSTLINREKITIRAILRMIVLRYVYSFIDIALYVGTNNKQYFKKFGLKENQLIFVPHAVDNSRFCKKLHDEEGKCWRKKLGIGETDLVFLFAGKLQVTKNPEILIKAFHEVRKNDTHLIIVGNGELEAHLKKKYSNLVNLHFVDFQNQSAMPGIYSLCDVFVLPSRGPIETWGLAVNEAMANEKAIIVSNVVGCAVDLVKNEQNGFIFESENLPDLISKLKRFISNRDLAKEMGIQSGYHIQNWSIPAIVHGIVHTVNKIKSV